MAVICATIEEHSLVLRQARGSEIGGGKLCRGEPEALHNRLDAVESPTDVSDLYDVRVDRERRHRAWRRVRCCGERALLRRDRGDTRGYVQELERAVRPRSRVATAGSGDRDLATCYRRIEIRCDELALERGRTGSAVHGARQDVLLQSTSIVRLSTAGQAKDGYCSHRENRVPHFSSQKRFRRRGMRGGEAGAVCNRNAWRFRSRNLKSERDGCCCRTTNQFRCCQKRTTAGFGRVDSRPVASRVRRHLFSAPRATPS